MRKRILHISMILALVAPLVVLAVVGRELPDRKASGLEARYLAKNPHLSLEGVLSGQYFRDEEAYLSDQMPYRDYWVRGYMFLQMRILGKTALNDTVVGRDGQLLWDMTKKPVLTDAEIDGEIETSMDQFQTLDTLVKSYGGRFIYVGHPTLGSFLRDAYPTGFGFTSTFTRAEPKYYAAFEKRGIESLNLRPVLESHRDEKLFFKTDHHWTMKGAYYAYSAIVDHLGLTPLDWERDLRIKTFGPPYVGSMNRRVGLAFPFDETIDIAELREPIPYTKTTDGEKDQRLYYMPDKGDPYSYRMYMYGDHSEIVIDTDRPELPDILFFGDSFTNAVEPLLWANFNQTRILDLRHYQGSLYDYVEKYRPDYVVTLIRDEFYFWRRGNGYFAGSSPASATAE